MIDKPLTRKEIYLAAIAGQDVTLPEPLTRDEQYLYEIAMKGGSKPSGDDAPFELIETITVGQNTREIERTAEPDGTPYNFRKVLIKATMQIWSESSNIPNAGLYTNWADNRVGQLVIANSYIAWQSINMEVKNGRGYASSFYTSPNSMESKKYSEECLTGCGWYECDAITLLRIISDNNIPENSKLEIYAVRK